MLSLKGHGVQRPAIKLLRTENDNDNTDHRNVSLSSDEYSSDSCSWSRYAAELICRL